MYSHPKFSAELDHRPCVLSQTPMENNMLAVILILYVMMEGCSTASITLYTTKPVLNDHRYCPTSIWTTHHAMQRQK